MDGVRGLAILMVMVFHIVEGNHIFTVSGAATRALLGTVLYGWAGVDLFFVLSGFLITGILLSARGDDRYFSRFYIRRTLRIFPLYYAVLVFLFIVVPHIPRIYTAGLQAAHQHQWWYWTYLTNVPLSLGDFEAIPWPTTHLWSLAVEEQFYLVWPTVVFLAPTPRRLAQMCVGGAVLTLAFRVWAVFFSGNAAGAYFSTFARADALLIGALVAVFFSGERLGQRATRAARWTVLAGVLLIATLRIGGPRLLGNDWPMLVFGYSLNALTAAGLIIVAITSPATSRIARFWRGRGLRFFGRYSYGLYVFHVLVISMLNQVYRLRPAGAGPDASDLSMRRLLVWSAIYFAATIGLALVSWTLLEQPFLRLKDVLSPSRRPIRAEQTPAGWAEASGPGVVGDAN
jgi:peptidoglycan/LPS O-acetylase OafA/YrhL